MKAYEFEVLYDGDVFSSAINYIDDFKYGVSDMIYSCDEWDDHYELTEISAIGYTEVNND